MRLDAQAIERDRELYDPQINWLLNIAPSELGEKGTLGGTISALEHGGAASGVPNTDPYSNYQMGWCAGDSPADKWRKAAPVWFRIGRDAQGTLLAHYTPRNDLPETQRVAVDGALGKLANAALWVTEGEALARLVDACVDKGRGGRKGIIAAALKRADEAVRTAHRVFAAVRDLRPEGTIDTRDVRRPADPERAQRWEATYLLSASAKSRAAAVLSQRDAEEAEKRAELQRKAERNHERLRRRCMRPFSEIAKAARRAVRAAA